MRGIRRVVSSDCRWEKEEDGRRGGVFGCMLRKRNLRHRMGLNGVVLGILHHHRVYAVAVYVLNCL